MDAAAVLQRAQLLAEVGRPGEALELIHAALAEHPHDADLLGGQAALALAAGDPVQAYLAARAALDAHPDRLGPRIVLTQLYLGVELVDEAVAVARTAVEFAPTDAAAHALLAGCLAHGATFGRSKREARAAIERALALAPDDVDVIADLVRAAERIHDADTVRRLVEAGLRADPAHPQLQLRHARGRDFTREQAGALTELLADHPTDARIRHALAEVVWGTLARLASGVWIYALAVMLLSAWLSPAVLKHLVPVLMAPLIAHWVRLFTRLRRRLPRGYLAGRVGRSPAAAGGLLLAAVAALLATFAPLLIAIGPDADGVRFGYQALIVACLIAGLAHLLVTAARLRRGADVDLEAHLAEQEGTWAVWLLGLGVPTALCWALSGLARQPGALWYALMVPVLVLGVLAAEFVVKYWRRDRSRRARVAVTVVGALFLAGCGWLMLWCGAAAQRTDFRYTVGPLSPERRAPAFTPIPTIDVKLPSFPPAPSR
ncbi:tetratricopeptide repeat protein [Mycobacterium sp. 1274756.6]|uniref:tetratricopeptide repeat protein n=1 Tax=Mycobacterium sp. 1274756.6 TaxID=1834076 RepID=UPI0007FEA401|nr:tetratricopeptide repeat protein [Mycobacterium sp. 1274756.6]OBJ71691.1 hypothetical protein A5643_07420 [Mycobacterium sp. 1274756.6]